MDGIDCRCESAKCFGTDTSLLGDVGLFSAVDGPASWRNSLQGPVGCSPCSRAWVAPYCPPVGSYGVHSSGSGRGGTSSVASSMASSMGLSSSGSSGTAGVGSMYNSIEECSRLCPWLHSKGERARCSGDGGRGGLGRGSGRGLGWGDGDWVGDRGSTVAGTGNWESCGKADRKMTAWLLFNGAGVVDRAGPDDEEGSENEGE